MMDLSTIDGRKLRVTELNWNDCRSIIKLVDAELVTILDEISESVDIKKMPLYKISYPFGAKIIEQGKLYFSTMDGDSVAYDDMVIPESLTNNVKYRSASGCPMMVLEKKSESYIIVNGKPYPLRIVAKGDIVGLGSILGKINPDLELEQPIHSTLETLISGVRSTFILPKVSDEVNHRNLKVMYNLKQDCPQSFHEHWLVFKDIARTEKSEWQSEFLLFSKEWLEYLDQPLWSRLAIYFLNKGLAAQLRMRNISDSLNMLLGYIDQTQPLKFTSSILSMAKYMFDIAAGNGLCFRPSINSDCMPVQLIQSAYINGYGIEYCPIVMEATYINTANMHPGYYFQNYPLSPQLEFDLSKKYKSFIEFIKEVQFVVNTYQKKLKTSALCKDSLLSYISRLTEFFYFHEEDLGDKGIKKIEDIFKEDDRFWYNQAGEFPLHSNMLRGCIRVSYKTEKIT